MGVDKAALNAAQNALLLANKDVRPFIPRDFSRFYMLHGTLTDTPITTTASTVYTSLTGTYSQSKQIKFTLQSTNNGQMVAYYSLDGITYIPATITPVQAPPAQGDTVGKYNYQLTVNGPVISAYYTYTETTTAGAILGGILSLESVVV